MTGIFGEFNRWRQRLLNERKLKNEVRQLQHRLNNFHSAVNLSSIVSLTDKQGRITYANDNFLRISGYSREELIGHSHNVINSNHHPKTFWSNMWKEISQGITWREEVCNRAKDGTLYWVDTFIHPYRDAHGNLTHFLSIRNDITKRKQQELVLLTQNKALSDIAWTQAHELRRPVASILGLVQLIQHGHASTKDGDIVNHLAKMTKELDDVISKNIHTATVDYQMLKNHIVL